MNYINLSSYPLSARSYLTNFQVAQQNLMLLIREEPSLRKRYKPRTGQGKS